MKESNLPTFKLSTVDLFKKGFAFPEVAKNDFAMEQLDHLEAMQRNFSGDLENEVMLKQFSQVANEVSEKLSNRYQDMWAAPGQ